MLIQPFKEDLHATLSPGFMPFSNIDSLLALYGTQGIMPSTVVRTALAALSIEDQSAQITLASYQLALRDLVVELRFEDL